MHEFKEDNGGIVYPYISIPTLLFCQDLFVASQINSDESC